MCLSIRFLSLPHLPGNAGSPGREFVASFLENYNRGRGQLQLFITAVQANAEVTVLVTATNFKQKLSLKAGERSTVTLRAYLEVDGSQRSSRSVLIVASADVTVTSLNSKKYTADTSVVYPTTDWGTEYFIFTPGQPRSWGSKEFSVTNGKEANRVEISVQSTIRFEGRYYQKGQVMKIDLKPYETVQLQSPKDLSGTRVASQHPVAVFSGHTCITVFSKCNHVFEQLLPVSSWGSNFIVPPVSFQTKYDSVYIQASQVTRITVYNGNQKQSLSLSRGEVKEFRIQNRQTVSIQADHGIQVFMLFNGVWLRWAYYYDPFLFTVLPTDHFCSSYSFNALQGFNNHVLIVAPTNDLAAMRYDGKSLAGNVKWSKVSGFPQFSWAQMAYNQLPGTRIHTLSTSGAPFGLYTFGVSPRDGYGSAGQCMQPGKVHPRQGGPGFLYYK